tara:strand:- start:2114 stop:2284 length:171 start_codon:yes stop_codon:yes gene_type:complete
MTSLEMAKRNTPAKAGRKQWGQMFGQKKEREVVEQSLYAKTNSTLKHIERLKAGLK